MHIISRKLFAAVFGLLLLVTQAHGQGATYAPWQFLAGPTTAGPNAFANPRGIVGADLPNAASPNSGTLGLTNGGTGQTTAASALNALMPTPTRPGDVVYWNGTTWVTLPGNNLGTQFLSESAIGTPSWASPSGSGTVTSVTIISTPGIEMTGTCTSTSVVSCTIYPVFLPQGRLTLTTGTPLLTANVANTSTIYYDCFKGGRYVSVYNGTNDISLAIPSCEISDVMPISSTGVTNNAGVFDIWGINVSSALVICHATNGSGGGWASDTGGSNTARGTGYSQLDTTTRPFITNKNSITNCYNGSTQEGPISANQATYLGTLYTTAAGKTNVSLNVSGAGGSAPCVCLYNGYNRQPVHVINNDTSAATGWSYTSATYRILGGGTGDVISYVDGLAHSGAQVHGMVSVDSGAGTSAYYTGFALNWSSGAPPTITAGIIPNGIVGVNLYLPHSPNAVFEPTFGYNTISWVESCSGNCGVSGAGAGSVAMNLTSVF